MEILDDPIPYQDGIGGNHHHQPVSGDVPSVTNLPGIATGIHHQPDSPMAGTRYGSRESLSSSYYYTNVYKSHPEEDLSDPDRQDEESGEELPQQPLQGSNNHSSTDNTPAQTPLSQLSNLMTSTHPHFLAKLKLEQNEMDMLSNKNGLEALQAAISSGGFNLPFSFPHHHPGAFLAPGQQQQHQHSHHPSGSLLGQPGSNGSGAALSGNPSNNNNNSSNNNNLTGSNSSNNNNNNNGSMVVPSSASSHSSESSQSSRCNESGLRNAGSVSEVNLGNGTQGQQSAHQQQQQQPNWSFEEQFKQLYEINDDPKRKEFLDELFTFMQSRGSPINRLPIMAKSVLDLYELYNLVIARGGLVDVINKKLWQEIIKGLHLPSSITSAAFTLRTQYMKYLYPYECEKKNLSTPAELQAAIDGNKREGRRSDYGAYAGNGAGAGGPVDALMHQRSPHTPNSLAASLHGQLSPLPLVASHALHNGSAAHTPLPHHPHHPQHQQPSMPHRSIPGVLSAGFTPEMFNELMKQLQHERRAAGSPLALMNCRPGSVSPPQAQRSSPTRDAAVLEMSRFNLLNNLYNNNLHPGIAGYPQAASPRTGSRSPPVPPESPEPQREALDLGIRSSSSASSHGQTSPVPPHSGSVAIKREIEHDSPPGPSAVSSSKRRCQASLGPDDDGPSQLESNGPLQPNTHIKISNRGEGRDNQLVVSMELNGVMYQGVLFAQTEGSAGSGANRSGSNAGSAHSLAIRAPFSSSRNVVS